MSLTPTESLQELARAIVVNYVHFPRVTDTDPQQCDDKVFVHSTELLSLSIIWHGFHDAVKEGDGDRILRYWKLLLVIFKSTKEAVSHSHNITIYFLSDKENNYFGVVALTQEAAVEQIHPVIYTWNTSIDV